MLIGREQEKKELLDALASDYSEFIAVYGRRRVGKTFLIRETFNYKFTFQHTGMANATSKSQLTNFRDSLIEQGATKVPKLNNWLEAFSALKLFLNASTDERKLVFIDELPWLDTPKSDFLPALELFWNGWATSRKDIVLIVCGSATSWIVEKIINNHGGLHNRLTKRIKLNPFTLKECESFIESKHISMNRYQIVETYMVLGGIPYYWNFLRKGQSVAQNMDRLFFQESGELLNEFDMLYASLFRFPEGYIKIVTALGEKKVGMTRKEIIDSTRITDSGTLTRILKELEWCGFIRKYNNIGKATKESIYQLMDNYTLFYFQFIRKNHPADEHFWTNSQNSPLYHAWSGLAFERVCLQHIPAIKKALGISEVLTNVYSWRKKADETLGIPGIQIDLLIDRNDQVINLCEMKFSKAEYAITKNYDMSLRQKLEVFRMATNCKKSIHLTMVTTYGLTDNVYAEIVQNSIVMDNLF
ncbi:MAG: ATP-binding protein [Bacteroides sp.]|nr:ATP-binding protein [Bacteroides sp.]